MSHFFNRLCELIIHRPRSVSLLTHSTHIAIAVLLFASLASLHGSALEPKQIAVAPLAGEALSELPDAPLTNTETPAPSSITPIGSLPLFQPLSPGHKFVFATKSAFGLSSTIFAAAGAGVNQAQKQYPDFHQGAQGYARYYWHSYADQAVDSYFVDFLLPTALHQDPRYYVLGHGGPLKRAKYSLGRLFVTRSDSGSAEFNTSQVLGSGVATSISSLYYPQFDRTASLVGQRWASNLAGDGLLMVFQEFTPDICHVVKSLGSRITSRRKYAEE